MVLWWKAVSARIGSAWREVSRTGWGLDGKQGLSLMQRGRIYRYCVWPVLLYCSETWELTAAEEVRLQNVERRMIRMMCGSKLVDEVSSIELQQRVGLDTLIEQFIIRNRLRWYGRVLRREEDNQIRVLCS